MLLAWSISYALKIILQNLQRTAYLQHGVADFSSLAAKCGGSTDVNIHQRECQEEGS